MPNDAHSGPPSLTVGSLLGLPLGVDTGPAPAPPAPTAPSPAGRVAPPGATDSADWAISGGTVSSAPRGPAFRPDGVQSLTFNNPFHQDVERVWFDGKLVYALDCGEVEVDPAQVKVAQEYQVVYGVQLDQAGKLLGEPDRVPAQYNIYDSVPGMEKYSPIWQFNYVVVPRDYQPNTLRSEAECLASGYPVLRSHVFEN